MHPYPRRTDSVCVFICSAGRIRVEGVGPSPLVRHMPFAVTLLWPKDRPRQGKGTVVHRGLYMGGCIWLCGTSVYSSSSTILSKVLPKRAGLGTGIMTPGTGGGIVSWWGCSPEHATRPRCHCSWKKLCGANSYSATLPPTRTQ